MKEILRKFILVYFRAFLASPILRELSSVKQDNRNIKVRWNIHNTIHLKFCQRKICRKDISTTVFEDESSIEIVL